MELASYLDRINKIMLPKIHDGFDKTISDFYAACIEPNLPDPETVAKWHDLLTRYVKEPEAIFFVRRYASASQKNWNSIRRGFLTKYQDESGYVFCDNFFAHYFFVMAFDGFVPDYDDFKSTMLNRMFPYGSALTKEEKLLQAYPRGKQPCINKAGWKLAHLHSVNGNDYFSNYKKLVNEYFPRGAREEWAVGSEGYALRMVPRNMSESEREILKAHFLRLANPMNYFLVPMNKYERNVRGNDIGEDKDLLQYVFDRFTQIYKDRFQEYLKEIDARSDYVSPSKSTDSVVINIVYGPKVLKSSISESPNRSKKQVVKGTKLNVSLDQLYKMSRLYLEEGTSFRNLEKKVLGIESKTRGGGFVAKQALNNFGIESKNKGCLIDSTFEREYENATGRYRDALKILYPDDYVLYTKRKSEHI